jgi:hypothetical protein
MRKANVLLAIITTASLVACKKENTNAVTAAKIVGNWLVTGANNFHDNNGIVVEWGLHYVGSVKINPDNTFNVNEETSPTGTWKLKNKQTIIEFDSEVNSGADIQKDTTSFSVSINEAGELVLQRGTTSFRHRRI